MTSPMTFEPESLIYTEVADEFPEPTREEIEEYAKRIGIDVKNEPHLLYLAREGIQVKLPVSWSPCLDTVKNSFYYFNKETSQSQWEHPMDPLYREKVIRARGELALSRPPTLQPLNMRLPPVRKSGASLAPIKRTPLGSLGSLGGIGAAAGDLRLNPASSMNPPTNEGMTNPPRNLSTLNHHNNANSKNIISGSSLNSFKDTDDDDDEDEPSPPLIRPPQPKRLGLTLTGGGANFLKGSGPPIGDEVVAKAKTLKGAREGTPDSDDAWGDSDKRPIKSILVNSISRSRPANPSDNVYELDGFSMNLDEMTEEEKIVVSQLDSVSTSKSKGNNVKFNLDDNTELKFEMPGDDDEDMAGNNAEDVEEPDDEASHTTDTNEDESSRPSTREQASRNQSIDMQYGSGDFTAKRPVAPTNHKNYMPFTSEYSESDIEAMKAAMRNEMEAELKKFREQLEEERKSRKEQIQKHLEETVVQFKREKEETLGRIRKDMESEKSSEVDKTKREIDTLLKKELEEMKSKFGDALQQRQKELEAENEKRIQALTLEYRKKEEEKISQVLERRASEEMLKLSDNNYKKQKESLQEEHKKQLNQLKEYHKTFLDKVKANLQEEEEKLRLTHNFRRAEIVSQFEKETEALKKKLARSQEEALKKIQEDFGIKKASLEKSLNASLRNAKEMIYKSKRSASEINPSDSTPEDELRSMKGKYQELEKKYQAMKQELEQLTEDVTKSKQLSPAKSDNNENNKNNEQTSPNKQPARQSPMKAVGLKNLLEQSKSYDASDSAHGSESSCDSNSSVYPSSGGVAAPPKLLRENRADDPVGELVDEGQTNRINAALLSLEILKQEILELKQSNSKTQTTEGVKELVKPPPVLPIAKSYKSLSARRLPPKPEDPSLLRKKLSGVQLSPKGSKSARLKVSPSPPTHDSSPPPKYISRSVSVIPQDLSGSNSEPISEDAHQRIVDAAKAFIRMQKNRLKDPTPIPNSSHLILPTTKNNLLLFDEKLLKSVTPRRPASLHLDLVSETESSGVSSLKDHRSSESKKLSKDIDEICNSLNNLDQQMKLMWSVVKGDHGGQLQDESLSFLHASPSTDLTSFLPNTVPMILGKTSRLSPSFPTGVRKPLVPQSSSVSLQMPSRTGRYSNLLSNSQSSKSQTVLDALRMSGMSTTRLDCSDLLKSLEEELKEFKSTKQRLLDMQTGPYSPSSHEKNHATTLTSSVKPNNNHSSTILEKTKDLQEWLKKY